jgi:predicted PurR-regulated permease PerM
MTDTTGNVTRTLSRDEAWGWLVERRSVEMGGAELGRIWGWSRQRTDQWLDRLVQKGRIERRGRIVRVVTASPAEASQEPLTPAPSRELTDVDGPKNVPVFKGDGRQLAGVDGTDAAAFVAAPTPTSTPRTHGVDWQRIAFIVPGIALAAIIMTANARYVAAFAQSWDAALLLAGLGLCAETFGLIIPGVAIRLWNGGQRVSAATVWVILGLVVVPINLLAISGWSSQNLGDSIMGRALAADRNQGLGERLDRLRDERKALNETRSVAELDAALAAAQGAAGRAWGRTDECRRPDRGRLAEDLPRYQATISAKIERLRGSGETGTPKRAEQVLQELGKEIGEIGSSKEKSVQPLQADLGAGKDQALIPVEVHEPGGGPLQTLLSLMTPLLSPVATTLLIIVFVVFILLQREDLRNRLIRLAGSTDIPHTTAAIDDAAHRLSRLFLTQLAINTSFAILVGLGLWFIGIPSAFVWGVLAGVLRFVPYVGSILGMVFPLVLALSVDPGWSMVLWTAALFLGLEGLTGQVIEPIFAGHSSGLSPVAVVLAATFWAWLWGPVGLVLATPLTVILVVLGRHVDALKFLDVMFGNEPVLSDAESFYQRMLARDPVEAVEQAKSFMTRHSLADYCDEVARPALMLAQKVPHVAGGTKKIGADLALLERINKNDIRPAAKQPRQICLAYRQRQIPQVVAVQRKQVEHAELHFIVMLARVQRVEVGNTASPPPSDAFVLSSTMAPSFAVLRRTGA